MFFLVRARGILTPQEYAIVQILIPHTSIFHLFNSILYFFIYNGSFVINATLRPKNIAELLFSQVDTYVLFTYINFVGISCVKCIRICVFGND